MYGGEAVRARLRFDKSLINIVLDRFGIDVPLHKAGDEFEIVVNILNSPVFLSWIVQFGDKAEIIAPESLRTSMRELLGQIGVKYAAE